MEVNKKLRRKGELSAYEVNTARDMNTGENLNLQDDLLRKAQLHKRKEQQKYSEAEEQPPKKQLEAEIGNEVLVLSNQNKHMARSGYIVQGNEQERVQVQKIHHPWNKSKNLRNKVYNTEEKRLLGVQNRGKQKKWQEDRVVENKYDFWLDNSEMEDDVDQDEHIEVHPQEEEEQRYQAGQEEVIQEQDTLQQEQGAQDQQELEAQAAQEEQYEKDMILLPPSSSEKEEIQRFEEQPERLPATMRSNVDPHGVGLLACVHSHTATGSWPKTAVILSLNPVLPCRREDQARRRTGSAQHVFSEAVQLDGSAARWR